MTPQFLIEAPIGLLPVIVFFGTLLLFDSYRLVTFSEVVLTLSAGVAIAILAWFLNTGAMTALALNYESYSHTIAPVVEEALKASALVILFVRNRIGFMIDAAIMGFAIGAGFALFENIYFLHALQDTAIGVWIIRGFGTALMHGGTVALFGVIAQLLIERVGGLKAYYFLPGLMLAVSVHFIFNQFAASPLFATVIVLLGLPPLFLLVFTKSEHGVHDWMLHDYESHEHLLKEIEEGNFPHTHAGRLVSNLAEKYDDHVVADTFVYIKIHTELVLKAEQKTLAREKQEVMRLTDEDREKLRALHELEKKLGRTVMMTIWPHLHFSRRELWEIHELETEARFAWTRG